MERRFELRKEALVAEAQVNEKAFHDVGKRLEKFVEPFAACLARREQAEHAVDFVAGLVSDVERKNTESIVYTTDNGSECMTWPDGGSTPFKGEKATNWEGGFRVPMCVRWPGVIKPGTVVNDICAHEDLIPTFAAAAGEPELVDKVRKRYKCGDKTFKVHLDGYNLIPFLKGEVKESPRKEFLYWSDDGDLLAIRHDDWKVTFMEQYGEVGPYKPLGVWQTQFTKLRAPNLYNLRADPFERGPESQQYPKWVADRIFLIVPAQAAAQWLASFKEFPPRQKPASFNLDEVMPQITETNIGGGK